MEASETNKLQKPSWRAKRGRLSRHPHRHCLENVGPSTYHDPMCLHVLLPPRPVTATTILLLHHCHNSVHLTQGFQFRCPKKIGVGRAYVEK
jgi:hypothetical protein